MVLVPVSDVNPIQHIDQCNVNLHTLDEKWKTLVPVVMDCVLSHCPNFDEKNYLYLESHTSWLNHQVIMWCVDHMHHDMTLSEKSVCEQLIGDLHNLNQGGKNKIDFGEVVISP
jgi:hypothetical protein